MHSSTLEIPRSPKMAPGSQNHWKWLPNSFQIDDKLPKLNQFVPTGTNCISLFRYMRWTTQLNPNPRKCDPATYVWTLAVARWAQDNSKVTQNLKTKWKWHPDTMFFVFVTWFSVHFAKHHEAMRSHHITALAASHLHEWPTFTRATTRATMPGKLTPSKEGLAAWGAGQGNLMMGRPGKTWL